MKTKTKTEIFLNKNFVFPKTEKSLQKIIKREKKNCKKLKVKICLFNFFCVKSSSFISSVSLLISPQIYPIYLFYNLV